MAITNGYTTLNMLKGEARITDTADDARIERIIEAVSRSIDKHVGWPDRFFYSVSSAARLFTAEHPTRLWITDASTISAVKVDAAGDGTYETTWSASTDYVTAPYNATAEGRPFTCIEVRGSSARRFPVGVPAGVEVTAVWGWAAVPDEVEEACLIQSHRILKRADSPFGIASAATIDGSAMRLLARLDPDVEILLHGLARNPVGVG